MHEYPALKDSENLTSINEGNFEDAAMQVFRYQHGNNALYRKYCDTLGVNAAAVKSVADIPFLPILFFKTHKVVTGDWTDSALIFESSGTTGETPSRHYVRDAGLYETSLLHGFREFYGAPGEYAILALLPSYLERGNSSLVYMAKTLMEKSGHPDDGFYINEWDTLHDVITRLEGQGQKTLLLGVTFALLDFAETYPMQMKHTIVMETGGMKGRKEEWTRGEVHAFLKKHWQLQQVHSEYGMTELLSQSYSKKDGIFKPASTMRVLVRDINDPLDVSTTGTGCLNIIDLANLHSCSFIATDDIGNIAADGAFEVLGRADQAALRGCSLMVV